MSYLLDTNVISELRKGPRADRAVSSWFAGLADEDIFISALTVGEIRRGIESVRRRDADSARALDGWVAQVIELHRDRIVPVDRLVAEEWGRINVPDPLPVIDGLLAATARVRGLIFATRNIDDVERAGIDLFDPFSGRSSAR